MITPHPQPIEVLTCDAGEAAEGQTSVVTGVVRSVSPVRTFTTRRGTEARVKNIKLGSEKGYGYVNVACWNEAADTAVLAGDKIEVINAPAKLNPRSEGLTIDNGTEALLLVTDQPLTPAQRIRAGGVCKSSRLYAERIETVPVSAADLRERLKNL